MNILIIGLGSIGQRHLRNILKLYPSAKIYAYSRKFKTPFLNNANQALNLSLKNKYKINYIHNLKNLIKLNLNAALVCSPSSLHINESILLLKQNINIFVEKPLGSNEKNLKVLEKLIKNKNRITMIGFQLIFCPIIKKIKKIISNKSLGDLKYLSIHHGEHIKNFHKYENYKNLYAAKKKLGGGVILTQIHELDYMLHLLEDFKIKKTISLNSKISNLNIDVEDTLNSIFLFTNKKTELICNLHLNYYEQPGKRLINLVFENGRVLADLNSKKITYEKNDKKKTERFPYNRNDLFMSEIKYFLNHVKRNKKINNSMSLFNGIKTLKLALKLKKLK